MYWKVYTRPSEKFKIAYPLFQPLFRLSCAYSTLFLYSSVSTKVPQLIHRIEYVMIMNSPRVQAASIMHEMK